MRERGVGHHWSNSSIYHPEEPGIGAGESPHIFLRLGRIIASCLASVDERLPLETIAAIDDACKSDRCDAIAQAHERFSEGRSFTDAQDFSRAAAAFDESTQMLEELRSSYALMSRFRRAACLLHQNRIADASGAGSALLSEIENRRYRTLQGRVHWLLGLTKLHAARPEESMTDYRTAKEIFTAARDIANVSHMELLLADASEYAGDRDAAMKHRFAALEAMRKSGETKQLHLALFEAGTSSASKGWLAAADFLLAESIRESVRQKRFVVASLASMWRSTLSSRQRDFAAASDHARSAASYLNRLTDAGQKALVAANANQLGLSSSPEESPVEKLTKTIRFFEQAGNRAWLPQLLRQRALVHEEEGDLRAADADFRRAIDVSEETVHNTSPSTMRDGLASEARANYVRGDPRQRSGGPGLPVPRSGRTAHVERIRA
jgi:tetratricopeptide (TPR) repeat protein